MSTPLHPSPDELKEGKQHLAHTSIEHDASAPALEPGTGAHAFDKSALLEGIEKGVPLKHVDTVDKAAPKIEPDVHIGTNNHKQLLEEVTQAAKERMHTNGA